MPRVAPVRPRKMLPPPTTIAISTPRSARALVTSSAMRWTTTASIPNPIVWSAKASPESFSTTRGFPLGCIGNSSRAGSYGSAVGGLADGLFLSDLDPCEPADVRLRAERLHDRVDRLLVVLDERLLEKDDSLVEAVQLALVDLRPGRLGLALFAGLGFEDVALA